MQKIRGHPKGSSISWSSSQDSPSDITAWLHDSTTPNISSNRQKHDITNKSIIVVITSTLFPYIHLQKVLAKFYVSFNGDESLVFSLQNKNWLNIAEKHPAPKVFLKKTMSQVLLLSASLLSDKKTLVDIYPQNHTKSVLKQSYIQSSSCRKYDSNDFFQIRNILENHHFFLWWFGTKKEPFQNIITPLKN